MSSRSSTSQRPASRQSTRPKSSLGRPSSSIQSSSSTPTLAPPRPSTSIGMRPASSASLRPPTSMSTRPSTSLSTRPSTSLSVRSGSRATTSASGRIRRPSTRQPSRLLPHYQALVTQLTGATAEDDGETFRDGVEYVAKSLDQTVRPTGSSDMGSADRSIKGLSQKARIMNRDEFAEALDSAYSKLKTFMKESTADLDAEINTSRMPGHLQFLLALSKPPDEPTLSYANNYLEQQRNPSKEPTGLTWKDILAEEPFEGQHWQGAYGLPPGSTVENWDEDESDSSLLSLSALDYLNESDDDLSSLENERREVDFKDPSPSSSPLPEEKHEEKPTHRPTWDHLDIVESLQARQYWRPEWRLDVQTERPFDFGDPSTLAPAFRRALGTQKGHGVGQLAEEKYIDDFDAVREILMCLQGRRNLMISWTNTGPQSFTFQPASNAPRLLHLTSGALDSMLTSFAQTATLLEHLRKFVSAIFVKASKPESSTGTTTAYSHFHRRSTRTLEALSESIDVHIRAFDAWCASKEEAMCHAQAGIGPPLVISMLALEVEIRDKFASVFSVLVNLLQQVVQRATRSQDFIIEIWTLPDLPQRMVPSGLTSLLLDSLLLSVQEYSTMGDTITAQALLHIFCDAAEPIWKMVGRWLRDGMPAREVMGPTDQYFQTVDEEFFIEDNELVLLDPDFWTEGFVLRDGSEEESRATAVPLFLSHAAEHILGAGKAIGLLRALDMSSVFEREGGERWFARWPSFKSLLDFGDSGVKTHFSVEDFSRLVYDDILVPCMRAKEMLTRVLVDDCELWLHLTAMEDLYLMRKGDAMSNFVDVLFARMDSNQAWNDFHFLNSAFRDVVEAGRAPWIDPSLVRFSHRGSKDKDINRTVRAIDGLAVEYAVPFPLTYMFGPRVLQIYSSIFAFVLQIRRAQNALQRILIRNALVHMTNLGSELKVFYAMRSKLSWFVNVLLNFVCTDVLHGQIISFHVSLRKANSLDEMISLHEAHIAKLEGRCLLQRNTSALHRAVTSILDMTLHFSDCFVAFAGDTTHDISRQSLLLMKRHRSRRLKRQRKNVIGFSQSLRQVEVSSDSDDDEEDQSNDAAHEPSFSMAATTMSFAEEIFDVRIEKMSTELDALVRFIRRGVESLAGGTGEAASAFGVFAFALEDWDR